MNYHELVIQFKQIFQRADYRVFFSPGRINLIGEHTDYNGGNVFPCAITFGTAAIAKERNDALIRLYSLNFPDKGIMEFSIDHLDYRKEHDWANYPKGMIRYLKEQGYNISTGMDILFYGNIPNGAGLSSSASIELATGVVLEGIFNLTINRLELVKTGKRVENEFIGVNSGIMDQFAIGMGKANHAILLDCNTLKFEYAPIHLKDHKIIIMNTNKRRELADSKYNERRNECEQALAQLQSDISVSTLGELTEAAFEAHKHVITSDVLQRRARHAVYENQRTLKASEALRNGNLDKFGKLMNESHISLRDDYEVTGIELDTLVSVAWEQPGVLGARMTGAGFGGCAIAIVENAEVDQFIEEVGHQYRTAIGYDATFYVASVGDGAREVKKTEVAM
ncbi:galactokinase [Priestia koreensis]|uniref:Galactokinase n=1 Tax=Priestia koreensis TaxID=284581 RepID=A0A0M0KRU9_9BACI|nr:galactokinase [Priestia koreensis]KOO41123.1 galactokinase [Priestia koreensis]